MGPGGARAPLALYLGLSLLLDMPKYGVLRRLHYSCGVHTKRKCVLEAKLQNPLFDLVCLSFFYYFLVLEERDIKYIFTPDFNRGG